MIIASTTGYKEMIVYNNSERLFFILFIYLGNAMMAIGFGMMAQYAEILAEEHVNLYKKLRQINELIQLDTIPRSLRLRIESYLFFTFDKKNSQQHAITKIKELIPLTFVSFIRKILFIKNKYLVQRIVVSISKLFLEKIRHLA
jgi:hypothetical protein